MKSFALASLLFLGVTALSFQHNNDAVAAMPGSLSAFIDVANAEKLLQDVIPTFASMALQDMTVPLNIHESVEGILDARIDNLVLKNIDFSGEKSLKFVDGTDNIRFRYDGINADVVLNGDIDLMGGHMYSADTTLKGISLEFIVGSLPESDNVHFQVYKRIYINLQDVDLHIHMEDPTAEWAAQQLHDVMLPALQGVLHEVEKVLNVPIDEYNDKLKNQTPFTFLLDVFNSTNYSLNMTMATAPRGDHKLNRATFHIDATTYDKDQSSIHANSNVKYPEFQESTGANYQAFLHESFLNSILYPAHDEFLPYIITNQTIAKGLADAIPGMSDYYGADALYTISIDLVSPDGNEIGLTKADGIVVKDLKAAMSLNAKSSDMEEFESAMSASFMLKLKASVTMRDLEFKIKVPQDSITVSDVEIDGAPIPIVSEMVQQVLEDTLKDVLAPCADFDYSLLDEFPSLEFLLLYFPKIELLHDVLEENFYFGLTYDAGNGFEEMRFLS